MSYFFSLLVSAIALLGHGAAPGEAHGGMSVAPALPSEAHGGMSAKTSPPKDAHGGMLSVKKL